MAAVLKDVDKHKTCNEEELNLLREENQSLLKENKSLWNQQNRHEDHKSQIKPLFEQTQQLLADGVGEDGGEQLGHVIQPVDDVDVTLDLAAVLELLLSLY